MVVQRITKTSVEAIEIPESGHRSICWDDRLKGFGVRVTSSGTRTYIVQYRMGGRGNPTQTFTIGKHGSPWTADTAREHGKDILEDVRKGIDPILARRDAVTKRAQQADANRTLAFTAYAELFLKQRVTDRDLRREKEIRSIFQRDLMSYFKDQPITEITKKDVDGCLNKIGKRSTSSANKAYRWLKNMFNRAVTDDDLAKSPVDKIKMPYPESPRDRVLNDVELASVWVASSQMQYPFGPIFQLLMVTGQRLREVAEMEWSELDLTSLEWTIPASRTKNKKKHVVPLNKHAFDLLEQLNLTRPQGSSFVFSTNSRTPVSGFSRAKDRLDRFVVVKGVSKTQPLSHWTIHDLRRSFATGCQRLGIPIAHTEALLNHVSSTSGLVGIYQRHDYGPEKKIASDIWSQHLSEILTPKARIAETED